MRAGRGIILTVICLLLAAQVGAISPREMPGWVGDELQPVHIDGPNAKGAPPREPRGPLGVEATKPTGGTDALPDSVHVRPAAADLTGVGAQADHGAVCTASVAHLAEAERCLEVIEEDTMGEEDFARWVRDNGVRAEAIVAAIKMKSCTQAWHDFTHVDRALGAGLLVIAGEDLADLDRVPVEGRGHLGTYLGLRGRGNDVRTVLSSLKSAERPAETTVGWVRTVELLAMRGACPEVTASALKAHGRHVGRVHGVGICRWLKLLCQRARAEGLAERELIPWAEEALENQANGSGWCEAVAALVWGYGYIGQTDKAAQRGVYWLRAAQGESLPKDEVMRLKLRVGRALVTAGRFREAADVFREVVREGPADAQNVAQAELVMLGLRTSDVGEVEILPPSFEEVCREEVSVWARAGDVGTATVRIKGNPTFKVTTARCEGCAVTVAVVRRISRESSTSVVQLGVGPMERPGRRDGTLIIETNDPEKPALRIPVELRILPPIGISSPGALTFGRMSRREPVTREVLLTAPIAFEPRIEHIDYQQLITVELITKTSSEYVVRGTLKVDSNAETPARLRGAITIATGLAVQPTREVRFLADIVDG